MTLRALPVLSLAALALIGCAAGPDRTGAPGAPPGRPAFGGGPPPGADGPGPAGREQVFISPAGEPFRADAGQPYPVAAWFAGADADHDGVLTREEFVADALRFFDRLDTDRSGVLDGFEVAAYERTIAPEIVQALAPQARGGGGPPGGRGGPGGARGGGRGGPRGMGAMLQGAAPYSLLAEPQPVMAADADFNRRITRDEAARAAQTRFKLLDVGGAGRLILSELPPTPIQKLADAPGRAGEKRPPRR